MRLIMTTLTAAAALSLAACGNTEEPAQGDTTGNSAETQASMTAEPAPAQTPTDSSGYLTMASASDLFEIQSSELALEKSQNAGVREFAQMMIDHHRKTTQDVTAAARAASLTPSTPTLNSMQRDMMTQLEATSGADFDRMYIEQQRQAHQMALALHSTYAEQGDTPQLQAVARTAVPIIQQHITEAQGLNPA
ncbi:DUF4142 domain-containing protein [Croceibacterium mercuriale]|nr:DUF4142 domain-containing protein [Croceibacterium mercuriale]